MGEGYGPRLWGSWLVQRTWGHRLLQFLDCAISLLVGRVQVFTGRWGLGFLKASNLGICTLSLGEGCFLDPGRLWPGWWEATQASGRRRVVRGCPSEDQLWHELYRPRLRGPGWSLRPASPWPCPLSLAQLGLLLPCSFSRQLSLRVQGPWVPGAEAAPHMITLQACPLQSHRGN